MSPQTRLEGRPPEFTSPWDYFAAAAAASQHHHQQQQQHQHQQQQQQHHQQQQQQQRAAAAFGHPALSCGLESASSFDKNSAEYLRKRYLEYAASNPHAAAYLSALPEYARTMSVYGQAAGVCPEHRDQDIRLWGVEDVCKFLTTLEGCGIYAEVSNMKIKRQTCKTKTKSYVRLRLRLRLKLRLILIF